MKFSPAFIILVVLISGCADKEASSFVAPKEFFGKNQIGSSPDYGVIQFGNLRNHVITVHGFANDMSSCKEVAVALNANACKELPEGSRCIDPYSCIKLTRDL